MQFNTIKVKIEIVCEQLKAISSKNGLWGKKWQTEDGSTTSGADDHSRIKSQWVNRFFDHLSLDKERGLEITPKCSKQLLLAKRLQNSSLQWVYSPGRWGNNHLARAMVITFLIIFGNGFLIAFELLRTFGLTSFIALGGFPSILNENCFNYKFKKFKKNVCVCNKQQNSN